MKYTYFLTFLMLSMGSFACNTKAPSQEQENVPGHFETAKANYENTAQKVAQMREEAAKLRMTGSTENEQKAIKLEQEAAALENESMKNLNPNIY